MELFRGATASEILVLRVDAGEDLPGSLQRAVSDTSIGAGVVLSGAGVLEHVHLELPANLLWPPTVYAFEKQGPAQILSAQGHVTGAGPELFLTVARRGEVHGGKAMPGTRALHPVELVLLRAGEARWSRVSDAQTGAPCFQGGRPAAAGDLSLMGRPVDPSAVALVPQSLLKKHACLPVARSGDTLVVAMVDPSNPFAIEDLREATGLRVQAVGVPPEELMPALYRLFSGLERGF
jgi:predicted DNA-binding protein with PD1-like motif